MRFKSWEDFNKFLLEYARCSCLNCYHGGLKDLDTQRVFCMYHIAMVELSFQFCCREWVSIDKDKSLKDYEDETVWVLSDEIIESLEVADKEWTFKEIVEVINEKLEKSKSKKTDC